MFNSENKTHYKMYKAGKRWMFGAITVTMFTAGIAGGSFLSNGKSVHADTAVSTTQNQNNTSSTTTDGDGSDKSQDNNEQTKDAPVNSQSSDVTQQSASNDNDQKSIAQTTDTTDQSKTNIVANQSENTTSTDQKADNSTESQNTTDSNEQNHDAKTADQTKQQVDTSSQKADGNVVDQNKSTGVDQTKETDSEKKDTVSSTNQNQSEDVKQTDSTSSNQNDENSVEQNEKVADDSTAQNVDGKATDQSKIDNHNQVDESDNHAKIDQNADTEQSIQDKNDANSENQSSINLNAQSDNSIQADTINVNGIKIDLNDPDYQGRWVDPDQNHYTFGYNSITAGFDSTNGVATIVYSTDRSGDGNYYVHELDTNGNVINSYEISSKGATDQNPNVVASKSINDFSYYNFGNYSGEFAVPYGDSSDVRFDVPWFMGNPTGGITGVGGASFFIPQVVTQHIKYVDKQTKNVVAESTFDGLTGQKYDVTGVPEQVKDGYYYISLVPDNAKGTISQFGEVGHEWSRYFNDGTRVVYTETDNHGGMDVSLYSPDGTKYGDTYHIDDKYTYNSATKQYSWDIPSHNNDDKSIPRSGTIIVSPIYVKQSREITFEINKLGKLVPVDKDGNPIDNGSHDEPYQINPNDPTKAQQPTIPDIPGYVPVDPNDPSKVLTPGDPSPVPVDDPGKDTTIPYVVDKQTATITYVDQDGNKVLHTDDVDGKIGEHKDYSTKDELAALEKDGYSLVSSDVPDNGITLDYNSGKPLAYTVVVKRVSEPVSEQGTGSLTIHYQYADGQPVLKDANGNAVTDVTKQVTFHRDGTKNDETGETTWGDWIPDDGQDVNVSANSPVVTGYYANQKTASGQVTEGKNQTKLVIYNKLGNLIPEVPGGTPVPYPNDPDDPTKAGEPITPNYPGYTPLDPNGNPIKPGTPYPIDPNNPGKDTPVPYVADNEKATVNYVDQDDNNAVLHSDALNGKFGDKADYSTKDEIAALEAQGYELVTDGYPVDGYTYTTEDPTFTVVLKHKHKTVNPDNPGTPGQPVDPNNPDGPKYPDGTGKQDLTKNITRTIHYQYADGTQASKDVTEQVKYTREITFDEVTGKIIETGKWTSTDPDYAAVDSPAIAGFTPDQAVVGQAATTADDSDSDVTVIYNANAEQAHVNYVDQDNNDSVIKSDTLDGKFGTKSDYSTKDEIAALEAQGYELVTDGYPGDYTFTTDDPTFTVVLKHKHKTVDPDNPGTPGQPVDPDNPDGPKYPDGTGKQDLTKNITRTIHYQYADGTQASKDVTEQVKYTREITFDEVTGKIIETGKWTSTDPDYAAVDSPAIAGFTPDQAVVGQAATTADDSDSDVTVIYNANAEQAHVNYVDQDNNDSVIKSDTLDGKFGTKSDYSTKDEIAALEAQGYELVTDGYPGDYTFTTDDPTFTVVLKHKHKTVDPDNPGTPGQPVDPDNPTGPKYPDGTGEQDLTKNITRTIHYQYADGTQASKDVTEQVKYTREITFDEVTGKIIETGKWTSTNPDYAAVDSPAIAGFTPDQAVVGQAATTADDSDSDVTVIYNANAEQAHVNYVDQDNNDSVIKSDTLDGKFGTKSDYSTKDEIAALEAQGYELVTDGYPGDYTFTTDDPTFTVVLKHKHKTVDPDNPGTPGQPVDPDNPTGPKYPDGTGEQDLTKNITRTIHYQYADGTQASKDVTEQVKYTREITFDEVTGKIIETGKWTSTNPDYAAVDSPAIAGFTPDQAVVGQAATTADDSDSDVTVIYNANAEQAHVNYVDQDNNDSVIKSDTLDGKFGTKSDYSTKDEIAALEAQGYELVTDGYPGDYTFTTDDPTFTVVLKHKHKTVDPDNPGTPGQPVDPDNPTGPKYPDGTGEQDLTKNITRTIHYQYADGTQASKDVTEQVKYTREITFDEVTGKIIETGKWTSTNPDYAAVDSPAIAGFTPDQAVVGQAATTADDSDSDVTVIYNANAEQAHVNYVDQDNNDSVIKSDTLDGKFGTKSDYSTKDEIAALEAQGYELVTDGYPGDYTFTTDDPTFTVVLKHKHKTVDPDNPGTPGQPVDPDNPTGPKYPDGTGEQDLTKNITRTIHYQYADGTQASKDVTEQVKYTREITFDEVTGKIIETGKWTSTNPDYAAVDSPAIAGFTPDQAVVGQAATTADDSDSNVTVIYNANAEQAHVNYVDQDNNDSVIKSDTLNGKFGTKSDYSTKDEIAALEAQGYELVTDGYPGDYTFTTDDPTFTVVLKHKHKTVDPDNPGTPGQPVDPDNPTGPKYPDGTGEQDLTKNITRTIHYQYADGTQASKDVIEQVKYTREITFDEVTGKIIETGKWTSTNPDYAAVDSPAIAGFTPDQAVVGQAATTADDSDIDVTVIYNANAEQAHVNYVDQDNNDSVIKSDTLDGKFGTKSDYSTKDEIAALEAQGYELVTDGYPGDYTFTTDDPTFTVVLKHKTGSVTPDNPGTPGQPVDPNNPDGPKYPDGIGEKDLVKDVTRTIHYKDDQGNTVAKDVVESTKFGRNATFDEVTGKIISYGNWTPVNDTFGAVNSPVINGYYTDTPEVSAETVNADASNSEVTVLYHALGHLVPDVPGSTPIIYPNNPDNPSEAGNPLIPDIPGYTPVDKNGNKLTPGTPYPIDHDHLGEDTPIHYVKNEEPATPVTPSTPETPAQPAEQPSAPVTPATPVQPETPAQPAAPAPEAPKAEAPAQAETPAPAAKPAEAPKKAALPQTGQDATGSLMSIIGAILLSILGFFGLDGFRKRKEEK